MIFSFTFILCVLVGHIQLFFLIVIISLIEFQNLKNQTKTTKTLKKQTKKFEEGTVCVHISSFYLIPSPKPI